MAGSKASSERRAALVCAALVCGIALAVSAVGMRVSSWALDEILFRLSATHYSSGLPDTFLHDPTARSTSRLYALTLMPIFSSLDGDQAVRLSKLWNCILWCSTAIPLWLLAKPLLSPWRRVAAVTLAIASPWIVLTTALFTESLALPAFAWFSYAALCAVRRPVWWRDLLVLVALAVAVAARAQMVGLLGGYLLLIVVAAWPSLHSAGSGLGRRLRALGDYLRDFPFAVCATILVGVVLVGVAIGSVNLGSPSLAGPYTTPIDRHTLFNDGGAMVLVEALAISFGLGIVAVLFALPWYARTLKAGERDESWWFAAGTFCITAFFLVFTAVAQSGFLGLATEERYWIYPSIFVWTAAFAAARQRSLRPADVAIVGAILVVIAASLPVPRMFDPQSVFLAPVLATLGEASHHALKPLTKGSRDEVALAALVVCAAVYLCLRYARRLDPGWLLAGGAALQLTLTIVPLLATTGTISDKADRTGGDFDTLSWVDHATTQPVDWISSDPHRDMATLIARQRDTLFWNRRIDSRSVVSGSSPQPDGFPLDTFPTGQLIVDPASGALQGRPPGVAIVSKNSSYLQLKGHNLASAADGVLSLIDSGSRPSLLFRSQGLSPGEGIPVGRDVTLSVWPANKKGARLVLSLGPLGAGGRVRVTSDAHVRVVRVPDAGSARVSTDACGSHPTIVLRGITGGKAATGERLPDAAVLSEVAVSAASRC